MKAFFRLLVWITGFMFLIALLSLLSFPAFTISVIAIWYFSKKDPNKRNRNIAVVVAVFSFFGILLSVGGGEEPEVAVEPETEEVEVVEETETEELEQEPEEEVEEEVEEEPEVVEEEPEPEVSQEYKNALKKAETYSNFMNMSKKGIYDQLTSEYGEGFEADSAQYAIDTIEADWNKNALEKAKVYYEDMAMSKDRVYQQLVSEYGEQFTAEEAQYAVDNLD